METNINTPKKMLSVATSISMVMISASILLFSVHRTFAEPTPVKIPVIQKRMGGSNVEIYPFGVNTGKAYWIEYNDKGWNFKSSAISAWTD